MLTVRATPALFMPAMDALHGSMGAATAGDMLIAISRGGASSELNDLGGRLQEAGVVPVSLTTAPASALAQMADISVILTNPAGADPGEVIAMGSTLAVGAWGDALAYALMVLRAHSWEQVLHNHPAGAVGMITQTPVALSRPKE